MNGCLNVLWHFPFFGFLFAFFYALWGLVLCCTVVLYPVGQGYFQIARFLLSPFTSALVTRRELDRVRPRERSTAAAAYSTLIKILYAPFGLVAALAALFVIACEFLSLIGIPCGIVWFKALRAIFSPIDMICVPKAVADEIERIRGAQTVRRFKGEAAQPNTDPALPDAEAAERPVGEQPTRTPPTAAAVRQYQARQLHEIIANAAMYKASLVEACRHELDIRRKSTKFTAQVAAMDDARLREILANPQLYAE